MQELNGMFQNPEANLYTETKHRGHQSEPYFAQKCKKLFSFAFYL